MDIKTFLNIEKVDPYTEKYFYNNSKEYCCPIDTDPMFEIKSYDYMEPIKKLYTYYKNPYYQKLLSFESLLMWHYHDNFLYLKNDHDINEIMLQYIKCIKNSTVMIVYPSSNVTDIFSTTFYEELLKNGEIHGIKELDINQRQLKGIIYQVYYDKSGFKMMDGIEGKKKHSVGKGKLYVVFYKANNFEDISGKDAPLKIKLRETLRTSDDTKLNYFLHCTDNHTQVIELAKLFCNQNSIDLLLHQRIDHIINNSYNRSLAMFMTFKNWLYQNVKPIDQMKYMLFSSIVLYSLGTRVINDLDLIIWKDNITEPFIGKNRFSFIDVSIKQENNWITPNGISEYLHDWFDIEYPALFGAKDMEDVIFNPRYHYYYFGMKIICLQADIQRRIKRSRPAAYADLIALMLFNNQKIEIPPFPEGYWKEHVYYEMTNEEKKKIINTIKFYMRKRYHVDMDITEIKKILNIGFEMNRINNNNASD